jgi:hypothetical protein
MLFSFLIFLNSRRGIYTVYHNASMRSVRSDDSIIYSITSPLHHFYCHLGLSSGVAIWCCHMGCDLGVVIWGLPSGVVICGCHLGLSSVVVIWVAIWDDTLPILIIYWKLYSRLHLCIFYSRRIIFIFAGHQRWPSYNRKFDMKTIIFLKMY